MLVDIETQMISSASVAIVAAAAAAAERRLVTSGCAVNFVNSFQRDEITPVTRSDVAARQ